MLADKGKYEINNSEFLTGANISVAITNDFMEAVKNDTDYALMVENKPQSMLSSGTAHFLSGSLAEITKGGVKIG